MHSGKKLNVDYVDVMCFPIKEIYLGDEERPRGPGPAAEEIKG